MLFIIVVLCLVAVFAAFGGLIALMVSAVAGIFEHAGSDRDIMGKALGTALFLFVLTFFTIFLSMFLVYVGNCTHLIDVPAVLIQSCGH